jgi:cell division protein ZapA
LKQREVTILGQSYVLGCPDGGEALLSAAVASVDREMSAIRDAGKVKARERIAVLAALNLAYQLADRAQRPAPAPSASTTSRAAGDADDVADAGDLDALIRRVDAALGDDGQLL